MKSIPKMKAVYRLKLMKAPMPAPRRLKSIRFDRTDDLADLARRLTKNEIQEVSLAFFMDASRDLTGVLELSRGGITSVQMDRRLLFAAALLHGAEFIVLAHNHPSGNAKPSRTDVVTMKKLIPAGKLLGLTVWDHIVITDRTHISMREYGLLPDIETLVREEDKRREEALDAAAEGRL